MIMKNTVDALQATADFSLVLGEPLFQILGRPRLPGSALELVRQWILVICLITWLPLVAFSGLEGYRSK